MSPEIWDAIRPYLSEVKSIDFTGGGEPLLQPKRVDWICEAHEAGCETGIVTNGLLLNEMKTLQIANKTKNEYRICILTADGRAQCDGGETDPERVFSRIMNANVLRLPINTVYTGQQAGDEWNIGKPVLERLARATNGKFKIAQ